MVSQWGPVEAGIGCEVCVTKGKQRRVQAGKHTRQFMPQARFLRTVGSVSSALASRIGIGPSMQPQGDKPIKINRDHPPPHPETS